MRSYIFTERNGIHIIDLQQTVNLLDEAYEFVRDNVAQGGTILFVGTKRQAQDTVHDEADRCGMPYVNERWLGGTITNWFTIQKRIFELERLERMRDSGEIDLLTKKEGLMIEREIERLEHRLSGIRTMKRLPDLLFVVDVMREETAVHEANLKEIPVIAMVDTNCDPKNVDYIIPSNDDAIRAIKLIVGKIADAVMEGKAIRTKEAEEEEMMAEPMPAEVSRFIEDEDELEDEELLGESTLKYLGSAKKSQPRKERAAELAEAEAEEEVVAEVETPEAAEKTLETQLAEREEVEEEAEEEIVEQAEEEVVEEAEEEIVEQAEEEVEEDTEEVVEQAEEEVEEDTEEVVQEAKEDDVEQDLEEQEAENDEEDQDQD